jgi:hypothetical protein
LEIILLISFSYELNHVLTDAGNNALLASVIAVSGTVWVASAVATALFFKWFGANGSCVLQQVVIVLHMLVYFDLFE